MGKGADTLLSATAGGNRQPAGCSKETLKSTENVLLGIIFQKHFEMLSLLRNILE